MLCLDGKWPIILLRVPLGAWGSLTCSKYITRVKQLKVPPRGLVPWIFPSLKIRQPLPGLNPHHSSHEVGTLPLDYGGRLQTNDTLTHCGRMSVISVITFQAWQRDDGDCRHYHIFRFQTRYTAVTRHRGQATAQLWAQMFTQVLGMRPLLIVTSQPKERPFVLFHSQAICSQWAALLQYRMSQGKSSLRAKKISGMIGFFQNYYLTIYPMFWGYF
jgi:hypothetical protein